MQRTITAFKEGDTIPSFATFIYASRSSESGEITFFYEVQVPMDKPDED